MLDQNGSYEQAKTAVDTMRNILGRDFKAGKILSEILKRKKNAHHKKQKEIYSKTLTRKGALVKKKRIKSKQKVVQAKKA